MAKWGSHNEVIAAFINGNGGPYQGSNVFFEDDVLYSYGYHFPMAIRNWQRMFVINGDKASISTSKHQSILRGELRGTPHFTTSFSAIREWAGNEVKYMVGTGMLEIVDYEPDKSEHEHYWNQGIDPERVPVGAHIETHKGRIVSWHLPASVVLKLKRSEKERFAIASLDENQFFISELPRPAYTVDDAFMSLKPDEVIVYENETQKLCPRQGEWFFIQVEGTPYKERRRIYDSMEQNFKLVGNNPSSFNPHVATRGTKIADEQYVSGHINHPQHRRLTLSYAKDPLIFKAVENTAIKSFSSGGNVD